MRRGAMAASLVVFGCLGYLYVASQPTGEAIRALASDGAVRVTAYDSFTTFLPARGAGNPTGLLFLPGTPVDPRAYAPITRAVAEHGFPAAIVSTPWRGLTSEASSVMPERIAAAQQALGARRWVIAGHSRGGAFAARIVADNPGAFAGLVLVASVHPIGVDLRAATADVTQLSGDRDRTTTRAALADALTLLPPSTRMIVVRGGNHSQFGFYGKYPFDGTATIPRSQQIAETVDVLLAALERQEVAGPAAARAHP
jgi:pimeloyl-ACP methyl ester carboxylesterase